MDTVAFVILHYLALEDTIECIESIFNNVCYDNIKIVIVDNASFNKSGLILKEKYKDDNRVTVILNDKNIGFAKGNNIGYKYAKDVLNAKYIICLNNDTIIEQENFVSEIINIFNRTNYYVLGPDIISIKHNNYHQNPAKLKGLTSINEVDEKIKFLKKTHLKCIIKKYTKTDTIIKKIKIILNKNDISNGFYNEELENVKLHGACLIYSQKYIEKLDYAFYPETYMYMEEDILYYICNKNKFKTLYSPKIKIFHKEDVSTDKIKKTTIDKDLFVIKCSIESANILKKIMQD